MNTADTQLHPAVVFVDGQAVDSVRGAVLNIRTLRIGLRPGAGIEIYCFNTLMLPIRARRVSPLKFNFEGPMLGIYHDTADPREGPFVNHYINKLEVNVEFPSDQEASIEMIGVADLALSSFDKYWYRGPTSGSWSFESRLSYRFLDA